MVDLDGRDYLDFHAAFGAVLLGHADERVARPAAAAAARMDLVGLGVTALEVELAELVVEAIPCAEMTISTMSGSEAVAQAVRLARAVTGRRRILKFQGCFHGSYDAVARNVISPPERTGRWDPLSSGILPDALEHTLVAEFNDLASVQSLLEEHSGEVAAVLLEPTPHNVGALLPEPGFLEGLRELSSQHGALLVFDEVISGFRHALGGFQELSAVTPDLTTFGKAVGNGYPIAGLAGRADLLSEFSSAGGPVMLAGTFNGTASATAAAIATISVLKDPEVAFYEHVYGLGDRMRAGLREITGDLGVPATTTGLGSVFVTYFLDGPVRSYRDLLRNDDHAYLTFHRRMSERGFLMYPMALKRNHLSLAHTADDVDRTLEVADQVLRVMLRDGDLAGAERAR